MQRPFTMIAAAVFLLMALVHGYRLITHFQIVIGSHAMGMAVSLSALLFTLIMAWGLFREARR